MLCPTCLGATETSTNDLPGAFIAPPVLEVPCMTCLGSGEVPDDLTLEDLSIF